MIHGPGHLGSPCPDATFEVISDPEEEYGDFEMLFMMEKLQDNFEEVEGQMAKMAGIIELYRNASERQKKDPDADIYVDEARGKWDEAVANFTINGKKLDIGKLSSRDDMEGVYNDIVAEINIYIEDLGKRGIQHEYLKGI